MAQGEKSDYSGKSRHRGLANAKKELQETPWSLQTHRCLFVFFFVFVFLKKKRKKIHFRVAGRKILALRAPETKAPSPPRVREYAGGPWQSGSCLPCLRSPERAAPASGPPVSCGQQATQWPAVDFGLAGDGCGEGSLSAEAGLLSADCR